MSRHASEYGTSPFVSVGYPKAGNTWLRLSIGYYLQHAYRLPSVPLVEATDSPMLEQYGCGLRGEFTHAPLEWSKQTAEDLTFQTVIAPFMRSRVLLLVRHPLDILVSHYMQARYRAPSEPYAGTFEQFIADSVYGLSKLIKFYQIWWEGRDRVKELHIWRYEAAAADPARELAAALYFLGETISAESIQAATQEASFANMQRLESAGTQPIYKSSGFPIFATGDRGNPDAMHVRQGRVGGYRDHLSAAHIAAFERQISAHMPRAFGYS